VRSIVEKPDAVIDAEAGMPPKLKIVREIFPLSRIAAILDFRWDQTPQRVHGNYEPRSRSRPWLSGTVGLAIRRYSKSKDVGTALDCYSNSTVIPNNENANEISLYSIYVAGGKAFGVETVIAFDKLVMALEKYYHVNEPEPTTQVGEN
jgi:hypothetical protein